MEANITFDLIDGTYKPSEAKSVLLTLIKNTINYHKIEMVSADIRYGIDLPQSEKRINELKEALTKIEEAISFSEKLKFDIHIEGPIEIKLIKHKETSEVF